MFFSKQIQVLLAVLGNALIWLANLPADYEHKEMTGREYIDSLDDPEQGVDVTPVVTNTAASVFAPVSPPPAPAPVQLQGEPVYTMTASANGYSRDDLNAQGWSNDDLIAAGHMTVSYVVKDERPNVPAAPAAIAPPPPPAVPASVSTPAAPPSAPANSDAPITAMLDSEGLPWDARIHSGGRTQTKDGLWTKKKGVQPGIFAQIKSELLNATPKAPPAAFVPLASAALVAPPPPAAPAAPQAPAAPVAPPPPAAPSAAPVDFMSFVKWMPTVGLDPNGVMAYAGQYGVTGLGQLNQEFAHLIPVIYADIMAARGGK